MGGVSIISTATGDTGEVVTFPVYLTAGTTSSIAFSVRAGATQSLRQLTMNGANGNRYFGGVAASSITVEEYIA